MFDLVVDACEAWEDSHGEDWLCERCPRLGFARRGWVIRIEGHWKVRHNAGCLWCGPSFRLSNRGKMVAIVKMSNDDVADSIRPNLCVG